MDKTTLNLGVIGVGWQGATHVQCFQALPNARVVAIADLNEARRTEIAARYDVPETYGDYHEMLNRADVDAVSVVLPDHLHRDACEAVAQAGKHILCEKPLATTVADAEAIVRAARAAGVTLMVNLSNRWQPPIALTKEAFDQGELGDPVYAYARLSNTLFVPTQMLASWAGRTKLPFWLMSHTVDRVRWVWGSEATRVYAVAHDGVLKARGIDTPDLYHATVEFANGAIATFESCWILPETLPSVVESKMEWVFTKGVVFMEPHGASIQKATAESYSHPGTLFTTVLGHPVGFVIEALRHFVDCVLAGKETMIPGEDGLAVCKICAAVVESAETRTPVTLAG